LASGIGIARRELGVEERAAERHRAAERPCGDEFPVAADVSGDDRRRLEDAGADHHAADEHDAVPQRQERLRLCLLVRLYLLVRVAFQGNSFLPLPSETVTSPAMWLSFRVPTK